VIELPRWEQAYTTRVPPWDIGRPQPAIEALPLAGDVIDVGCGTGEHTLLAASRGARALGIDISRAAIEIARRKARERRLEAAVRFEVGDAFALRDLGERFDVAIDSGLFHDHEFDGELRRRYADGLAHVLRPGGTLYLMCFSEHTPGDWGPTRITRDELEDAFAGWTIERLERAAFELNPGLPVDRADAWLLTARP
jgi:SAM-dependent methyltransferase